VRVARSRIKRRSIGEKRKVPGFKGGVTPRKKASNIGEKKQPRERGG